LLQQQRESVRNPDSDRDLVTFRATANTARKLFVVLSISYGKINLNIDELRFGLFYG